MQNETLARRYATAIFTLAKHANAIDAIGADLKNIQSSIYGNDDVRRFYLSPVFERSKKGDALLKAFSDAAGKPKVSEIALHSLLLLVRKRRESLLPAIVGEYAKLALAASGKDKLEIVSARDLSKEDVAAIVARLEASYGKSFAVTQRTDPSLLGGVRITMGDLRIDGSLAGRFEELARELSTNVPQSASQIRGPHG
jgi:F-type H+-transporting ATPase subunit delta